MPIYEYIPLEEKRSCAFCRSGFEEVRRLSDPPLTQCPRCGAPIKKIISLPSLPPSQGSLDDRAKASGFHKLKKVDKGVYEKKY